VGAVSRKLEEEEEEVGLKHDEQSKLTLFSAVLLTSQRIQQPFFVNIGCGDTVRCALHGMVRSGDQQRQQKREKSRNGR
jgi:hypothetical protein